MTKKRFLSALYKIIILCASAHLLILGCLALIRHNPTYINIFSILSLQEFFPGIEKGGISFAISVVLMLTTYFLFVASSKNKD